MTKKINEIAQAVREAIQDVAVGPGRGRDISREHAEMVMHAILQGQVDEVQVAVLLIALRMKRESLDEFRGLFAAMQTAVQCKRSSVDDLLCLADPFDGYQRTISMTPFIPPVLAACGQVALLHGVESVGPKHGVTAHKVYALAGIATDSLAADLAAQLAEKRWGYLDQRVYAPSLYALLGLRDRIVKRTAITTLERLIMPIRGATRTHLALGYVHRAYPEIYASLAMQAGYDSVLLFKGVEGGLAPALNKPIRRYYCRHPLTEDIESTKDTLTFEGFGDQRVAALAHDDSRSLVEQTLETGMAVLDGAQGTARNSLVLATGHILFSLQPNLSLSNAVEKVQDCLDNGSAKAHFKSQIGSAA